MSNGLTRYGHFLQGMKTCRNCESLNESSINQQNLSLVCFWSWLVGKEKLKELPGNFKRKSLQDSSFVAGGQGGFLHPFMKVNRIPVASCNLLKKDSSERSKIIYVRVYELCVIKECSTFKISFSHDSWRNLRNRPSRQARCLPACNGDARLTTK